MGVPTPNAEEKAPCTCYSTNGKRPENIMCYRSGILGTLSNQQDIERCSERNVEPMSKDFAEHITKFRDLGNITHECFQSGKDTWECVSEQASELA